MDGAMLTPGPVPMPLATGAGSHDMPGGSEDIKKGSSSKFVCQVLDCGADLTGLKEYHQRYKICDAHLKANVVERDGQPHRFCQQCGRFHLMSEFDSDKRSCRSRLERHNKRRRKHQENDPPGLQGLAGLLGDHVFSDPQFAQRIQQELASKRLLQYNQYGGMMGNQLPAAAFPNMAGNFSGMQLQNMEYVQSLDQLNQGLNPGLNQGLMAMGAGTMPTAVKMDGLQLPNGTVHMGPLPVMLSSDTSSIPQKKQKTAMSMPLPIQPADTHSDLSAFMNSNIFSMSLPIQLIQDPNQQLTSSSMATVGHGVNSAFSKPVVEFQYSERVSRISVKMLNRTPQDLPLDVRHQVMEWLDDTPAAVEAFLRPGCMQLTIDARMSKKHVHSFARHGLHRISQWLTTRREDPFWGRGAKMVIQVTGNKFCLEGQAGVMRLSKPSLPVLTMVEPAVIAPHTRSVTVSGHCLAGSDFHIRNHGGYLQCHVRHGQPPPGALLDAVVVELPAGTRPGVAWLEVSTGRYLGSCLPLLVADSQDLADELAPALAAPWGDVRSDQSRQAVVANIGFAIGLKNWALPVPVDLTPREERLLMSLWKLCTERGWRQAAASTLGALPGSASSQVTAVQRMLLDRTLPGAVAASTCNSCHRRALRHTRVLPADSITCR